jgi:hypothetical protein
MFEWPRSGITQERKMIKPTIGRVVLVHRPYSIYREQPEPALIAFVWSDSCINVGGFDANGTPFSATSVQLLQDDDTAPTDGRVYAEWMPYQKAVAAGEIPAVKHAAA